MRSEPPFKKAVLSNIFEAQLEDVFPAQIDPEVQACDLVKKIAALYCTPRSDCVPTTPKTYLSSAGKWGPYFICFMPHAEDEQPAAYDRHIQARLAGMGDHFLEVAGDHVTVDRPDDMIVLTFPNIDALLQSCGCVLQYSKCPGGHYEKAKLRSKIPGLQALVTAEREAASESVTYHHIEAPFALTPAAEDADQEEATDPYLPYLERVTNAFEMLVYYCADESDIDVSDLALTLARGGEGFELVVNTNGRDEETGAPRVNPQLCAFMRDMFNMLNDLDELEDVKFIGLKGAFSIKLADPSDGLVLIQAMLDNLEEERLACIDDLEGVTVQTSPDKEQEALAHATKNQDSALYFLPNSLPYSFQNAALLEQEGLDQGVLPFSMKELEYHLLMARTGGQGHVPEEYRAFRLH